LSTRIWASGVIVATLWVAAGISIARASEQPAQDLLEAARAALSQELAAAPDATLSRASSNFVAQLNAALDQVDSIEAATAAVPRLTLVADRISAQVPPRLIRPQPDPTRLDAARVRLERAADWKTLQKNLRHLAEDPEAEDRLAHPLGLLAAHYRDLANHFASAEIVPITPRMPAPRAMASAAEASPGDSFGGSYLMREKALAAGLGPAAEEEEAEIDFADVVLGDVSAGAQLYSVNCASCHGPRGGGDGPIAANMNPKPAAHSNGGYMNALSNEHLYKVIHGGGMAVGKSALMTAWGSVLSKEQIQDVMAFTRSLADPPFAGDS
jgi:mono/diheme cytochrome c family protein